MSSVTPGPTNSLTDVAGLVVGHAQDDSVRSGCSVVLSEYRPCVAAVDVRGGGPGTRETDAIGLGRLVGQADAIVLSGGSAFGLDAAGGVQAWLRENQRGFDTGAVLVPIVPSAILYDLANGGDKEWGFSPPYRALGAEAVSNLSRHVDIGTVGAGYGARAGSLQGGIGTASAFDPVTGATVGALVAANPFGEVIAPDGHFLAAPYEQGSEFGGLGSSPSPMPADPIFPKLGAESGVGSLSLNTTLGVVATDAKLEHGEAFRLACMAQAGLGRAIRPAFSPFDGDTVFALSTGFKAAIDPVGLARLGTLAADCLSRAIAIAVYNAHAIDPSWPAWKDRFGPERQTNKP